MLSIMQKCKLSGTPSFGMSSSEGAEKLKSFVNSHWNIQDYGKEGGANPLSKVPKPTVSDKRK